MQQVSTKRTPLTWFCPRHPTRGKEQRIGIAIAFLFGAIGVGFYLRSLADGLLCWAVAWCIYELTGVNPILVGGAVAAVWMFARFRLDQEQLAAERAAGTASGSPPGSPASDIGQSGVHDRDATSLFEEVDPSPRKRVLSQAT